jgi:hypothetical protein
MWIKESAETVIHANVKVCERWTETERVMIVALCGKVCGIWLGDLARTHRRDVPLLISVLPSELFL